MARGLWIVITILAARPASPQGNPVGPEFRINTYTTNSQVRPAVASGASGNFVVVWVDATQDGSSGGIFGQRFASSGTPLGPEFRVNSYTTGYQRFESVASDAAGNFVVVWPSGIQSGANLDVVGQRYSSSGSPLGTEFRINTYTTDSQEFPAVAADPAGNFVVVWSGFRLGSSYDVFGQRYAASGAPLGSEFRVNTSTAWSQLRPSVAADSSGGFVVVWTTELGSDPLAGIYGQRFASSGAPLGPEFHVNTYTPSRQDEAAVAMDVSGNFVVVWVDQTQDGSADGIFGQRYASSGVPLGPEFRVNSYNTSFQQLPSVAADSSGNFVVIWSSFTQDGSASGTFGQRYGSSGAPLGPEFRVNTYTTGGQFPGTSPCVASDSLGNFVAVWVDFGQDGAFQGIFGQRYSPILPVELIEFSVEARRQP